jgi:uncharacterized protein
VISGSKYATDVLAADVLHLILMPTEACNFRCTYCYEDFRLGRMRDDVVAGVEKLIVRRAPRLSRLDVSWFGGEPLAAHDVVVRVLQTIESVRRERPSLDFRSDMTTNGYRLDRGLFKKLHGLGQNRYQISFDGLPEDHDKKRIKVGGGGTFDRLWGNLLAIRESTLSFTVTVRLHVDQDNVERAPDFIRRLKDDFRGDSRFPLFLRLLSRWGGPNDDALAFLDEDPGREALKRLEGLAREWNVPVYKPGEKTVCYAARGNSFLIRADGRVNKCTLALNAPANQVGRLTPDGRLLLEAHRMSMWMRGLWNGSTDDLHCPMHGLADGALKSVREVA